jgi:hypothetical protein
MTNEPRIVFSNITTKWQLALGKCLATACSFGLVQGKLAGFIGLLQGKLAVFIGLVQSKHS